MSEPARPPFHDELERFVTAYRAERQGHALDVRALRERVLAGRARIGRHRKRLVSWLVPIAAVLAGSVAFAASAPGRFRVARLFERAALVLATDPTPARPAPRPQRRLVSAPLASISEAAPSASASTASVSVPPASVSEAASAHVLRWPIEIRRAAPARSVSHQPTATLVPSAAAAASAAPPTPSSVAAFDEPALAADLALYRVAHRLHFGAADYAGALRAWGDYLARYPNGTLAPEARLNRAVCFAHLGKLAEARSALTTIANGRFGGADRARARLLLEALGVPSWRR